MKKALFALLATFTFISQANAQFEGPRAPSLAPTTVEQALTMNDDTKVVLTGKIVNNLGDEKYTFKDSTGEITIEIDDEDWRGIKVTPDDTLEIVGEVDKEFNEPTKIDVKSFTVK